MLRLERNKKDRITIRFQKDYRFDMRFWRSVMYSAAFHLILFGSIKVQFMRTHPTPPPLLPVEVAIDFDDEEASTLIESAQLEKDELFFTAKIVPHTSPLFAFTSDYSDEIHHLLINLEPVEEELSSNYASNQNIVELTPPGKLQLDEDLLQPLRVS